MKRTPRCLFRIDIGGIKEFHVGLGGAWEALITNYCYSFRRSISSTSFTLPNNVYIIP